MKRVLISQRCDPISGRDETRDALDIRLAALLWEMSFLPIPVANATANPCHYVSSLAPNAIVLSGGNDIGTAPRRDATETALLDLAEAQRLPVLGICRGMQMINHHQGGRMTRLAGHVATRHSVQGPLVPEHREVNSYHDLAILPANLGRDLEVLATAQDGSIEALRHSRLPWLAVMWHPEREPTLAAQDKALIARHFGEIAGEKV